MWTRTKALSRVDKSLAVRSGQYLFMGAGFASAIGALIALPWFLLLFGTGILVLAWFLFYKLLEGFQGREYVNAPIPSVVSGRDSSGDSRIVN